MATGLSGNVQPFTQKSVSNPINQANIDSGGITLDSVSPDYLSSDNTGGGAGTGASIDPNILRQYDQSIGNTNSALGTLGVQRDAGYSTIDKSYNSALQQLLSGYNGTKQINDQNVLSNKQDYVIGKNTVRSNAGASLSGLLRLLGSRGAGGSSAALLSGAGTARGAVGTAATQQEGDIRGVFGKNSQALDQNWGNYVRNYDDNVSNAGTQRDNARGQLDSDINKSRGQLLQALASLQGQRTAYAGGDATAAAQPYFDQANSALNSAAGFSPAAISVNTTPYAAPELSKYTVNPNAAPTYQGQAPGNDYYSPYLAALLGKKQQTAGV